MSVAEVKLQQIRVRLATGDVDDVVGELNVVAEDIDAGLDELNGNGTSSMLKTMNRARIRHTLGNLSLQDKQELFNLFGAIESSEVIQSIKVTE